MIAYLILAHHRPRQLARLIERLAQPGTRFFVHFDGKASDELFQAATAALAGRDDVEFVRRVRCEWGGMSLVAATMTMLTAALDSDFPFDVAVLLSGQDYPIKSNARIRAFFRERRGRSVMLCWRLPSERWANELDGRERYEFWNVKIGRRFLPIFGPRGFGNPVLHRAWNGLASMIQVKRAFPHAMTPYGGSGWWALSRDAAAYLCRFVEEHPEVTRFFRWVKIPDEMFFQTILMNSPVAHDVLNEPLHFISWPPLGATSPDPLTIERFNDLAAAPHLFARKFDENIDASILDQIDRALLAPDGPEPSEGRGSRCAVHDLSPNESPAIATG